MATYESTPAEVNRPIAEVYNTFSDLTLFAERVKNLPDDVRQKIEGVRFEKDAIAVDTPQIGELRFEVTDRREPDKIVFGSPSSPVPLSMEINLKPLNADTTEVRTLIDVEIPMMLRPFVGPKMQEAANKFGQMISNLSK